MIQHIYDKDAVVMKFYTLVGSRDITKKMLNVMNDYITKYRYLYA